MKKVYSIEGIDCANCAAKIEDKINRMKNIEEANLNFMMGKLSIEFKLSTDEEVEEIMEEVRKLVKKLEPDAVIS
jgi:Cd2+/Zn2+-exporting ATPase